MYQGGYREGTTLVGIGGSSLVYKEDPPWSIRRISLTLRRDSLALRRGSLALRKSLFDTQEESL